MKLYIALLLSLSPIANQAGEITVIVPPGVNLGRQEVMGFLPKSVPAGTPYNRVEIVIYYFSEGIEKFIYNENSMQETMNRGSIRALIKLKNEGVLRKVLFIEADGSNREDILKNLALKLSKALAGL
ncbi:MAG: hypothetical protein JW807_14685 [Spirochaetes bacterium]|nr:hypothetical protein [Spirochaetota bacterium]